MPLGVYCFASTMVRSTTQVETIEGRRKKKGGA